MENNKIFLFQCERARKEPEEIEYVAEGVGYIKSRKADFRVMDMAENMVEFAKKKHHVLLSEVIADDTSAIDVDRKSIDSLTRYMEQDDITVLYVRKITDITEDPLDLIKFISIAKNNEVSIFDMSRGCKVGIEPSRDFGC